MSQHPKEVNDALRTVGDAGAAPRSRLTACNTLIKHGYVNPTLPCLRELMQHPQIGGNARMLQRTAEYLVRRGLVRDPGAAASRTAWISDSDHYAFWRSPDPNRAARSLLIVFTGVSRQFWISLDILHRILQHQAGQVLYLRDFQSLSYLGGITGWNGVQGTLQRLREYVQNAQASRLCVMGISAGGFGALRYGLELGADAVLALSPATDLQWMRTHEPQSGKLAELGVPPESLDLVPIYEAAAARPATTIVFGAGNEKDTIHARRLEHLAEIRLVPLRGFAGHNVMTHLMATGQFDALLQHLLEPRT